MNNHFSKVDFIQVYIQSEHIVFAHLIIESFEVDIHRAQAKTEGERERESGCVSMPLFVYDVFVMYIAHNKIN